MKRFKPFAIVVLAMLTLCLFTGEVQASDPEHPFTSLFIFFRFFNFRF